MSPTQILTTDTAAAFEHAVNQAVSLLKAGEVVALPTETVYGLAANALDADAVAKIFEIKGRPSNNPIIVHVASIELARRAVVMWPDIAERLAKAFWPGPLTLVLPRADVIPPIVTAGGATIGVRWPSHPFIQAVIRRCDFPLAAPSANPANELSPTTAGHVRKYFNNRIQLIVDGGPSHVGIESTVVDLSSLPARLLRPGMIHEQALLAITDELALGFGDSAEILKSPGQFPRHYAPKAKLILLSWANDDDLLRQLTDHGPDITHYRSVQILAHNHIPSCPSFARISVIPHDPEAFARALYAELHQADEGGAELIVVEDVPQTSEWRAIGDRLKRAAADEIRKPNPETRKKPKC